MNISEVSETTGLPVKTIRYYEEIGLITPDRTANGYRFFSDADRHKLAFLGRAWSLGFSIDACRSLLHLYNNRDRASADVKQIARTQLIDACAGNDRPDCPILADLAADGQS